MQISDNTLSIIKNYSTFNNNLKIEPGNVLRTIHEKKHLSAKAVVEEEFPVDFPIYDLNEFLGCFSLFDSNPELEFEEDGSLLTFREGSQGSQVIRYLPAFQDIIVYPTSDIVFPETDIYEFDLPEVLLKKIKNAASVLGFEDISLVNKSGKLSLHVWNKQNQTGKGMDKYLADIEAPDFLVNLKVDFLKMISGDYRVFISSKKIIKLSYSGNAYNLNYFIAVETGSKFA